MFAFVGRSVLLGLLTAVLLLAIFPGLRFSMSDPSISLSALTQEQPLSYNEAVRRASPAVVNIYTRRYSGEDRLQLSPEGLGSGVIMSSKGYILTNFHVISRADQVIVALQDGRIFTAQLVGSDRRSDIAVLKIEADNLPVIPQNQEYTPEVGDVVMAIGNPYNLGQTTTFGIISATGRSGISINGPGDFLQTDAAINQGNSGGALVNTLGVLVGINTASFQQATSLETYGISFAIPYKVALRMMNKIIADGRVIRGYIGIDGRDINPVMARLLDVQHVQGIVVMGMDPNGPAHKAGLRVNDVLIALDNKPVNGVRNAFDIVADLRPGKEIQVKVIRNGQPLSIPLTIGEEPEQNRG
ncbi:outer membrane-stress sensor serine endopeptidase DegS [Parasalinivibrio latis]|uniref:outer membrane-stress sensor serine endopeptidase DegS n=1 Tax=Parasalinivibrio latis TaxID=2952610 RepID=UPI0030DFF346